MRVAPEFAPFLPYCFLACYAAFLLSKPSRLSWLLVSAAGAVLGLPMVQFRWGWWASGLGLAAALWAVIAPFVRKKSIHPAIGVLILYPLIASAMLHALHPNGGVVLDRYLLAADGSFGLQPGFLAGAFLLNHPAANQICKVFYFGLPVAMVTLLHTPSAKPVVHLSLLLAVTAAMGFAIFPAVGSQAAFRDQFPSNPPATGPGFGSALLEPENLPRNFMPSMHAAWGIGLLLGAWTLGPYWRLGVMIYLLPMLLYTVASHYFFDIIVAVPWTFAVWSVLKRKWRELLLYLALTGTWLLIIRFGLPLLYWSRLMPWALGTATLATPALLQRRSAA